MLMLALALQAASVPAPETKLSRCYYWDRSGGVPAMAYIGDRACVDFEPPREITGVWIFQFEGSAFVEGANTLEEAIKARPSIWLTIDRETKYPAGFQANPMEAHAFRVRFMGRFAKEMSRKPIEGYGHFGMYPGLVLMDRLIVWEDLGRADGR